MGYWKVSELNILLDDTDSSVINMIKFVYWHCKNIYSCIEFEGVYIGCKSAKLLNLCTEKKISLGDEKTKKQQKRNHSFYGLTHLSSTVSRSGFFFFFYFFLFLKSNDFLQKIIFWKKFWVIFNNFRPKSIDFGQKNGWFYMYLAKLKKYW